MTCAVTGLTRKTWIKDETTYNTYIALAATDAVDLTAVTMDPSITYTEHESHVGTASLQGHIPGMQENKWSAESYIRPGAVGVAPDIGPLLALAIGKETVVGGTSVTYEPVDTCPTVGLEIAMYAGPSGEDYMRANGAWVETLTIEAAQGEPPKFKAAGGYAKHSMVKQGAACTAIEDAAETEIAVDTEEAGCLAGEPVVGFGTGAGLEDNGGDGYQVTSVDYAADTFVITPGLVGPTEVADAVVPIVPSQTLTGTPIGGVQNTVTVGGSSCGLIKATINITSSIKPRIDGTSAVPVGLLGPTKRMVTGEIELYELEANTLETGQAWNNATAAINLQFGPATVAARCKVQMPACQLKVVKDTYSDEDGKRITLAFTAQQSAAAGDEIDLIFD